MKLYWFRGDEWSNSLGNFGDWLTPYFLAKLTRHSIEWVKPDEAELFGCGSILEVVPRDFKGTLFTTGVMHQITARPDLSGARVLALRGPSTVAAIYGERQVDVLLGDLGLLCRLVAPEEKKCYEVGYIPHYVYEGQNARGHVIDIRGGIEPVMREVARCERIISSSLHGIILADSLGVENQWEYSSRVYGKGYKFADYAAAVGEDIEPGVWRLGDQAKIECIATNLERLVKML